MLLDTHLHTKEYSADSFLPVRDAVARARELGLGDEPVLAETRNELTGLPNRRQFTKGANKLLKNQLERWCVIAVDIENFKLFNEWYGHNRGDLLMTQIGMRLRIVCEDMGGVAGYFGQDDFCLMIPYIPERIDKLYSDIAALVSEHGSSMSFMPAFGVSIAEEDVKLRDLLDRAFLAVRSAKESYQDRRRGSACTLEKARRHTGSAGFLHSGARKARSDHRPRHVYLGRGLQVDRQVHRKRTHAGTNLGERVRHRHPSFRHHLDI